MAGDSTVVAFYQAAIVDYAAIDGVDSGMIADYLGF
jgi:hypothetical protein